MVVAVVVGYAAHVGGVGEGNGGEGGAVLAVAAGYLVEEIICLLVK